jgi:hypothetical protein
MVSPMGRVISPVTMKSLEDLPPELLDLIMEGLSRNDHFALCLTSKALNPVAERRAYRRFTHDLAMDETGRKMIEVGPQDNIHLLLRTFVSRPELALYFRELVFFGEKQGNIWQDTNTALSAEELVKVQQAISTADRHLSNSKESNIDSKSSLRWLENIKDGSIPAILGLILIMTENLETLKLDFTMSFLCYKPIDSFSLSEIVSKRTGAFMKLKKTDFRVRYIDAIVKKKLRGVPSNHETLEHPYEINLRITDYAWLFQLPAIEKVALQRVGNDSLQWPVESLPSVPTLKTLSLRASRIDEDTLGRLLKATPNLQHLEYDIRIYNCNHIRGYVRCDKLGKALAKVRKSLKSLMLELETVYCYDVEARWGGRSIVKKRLGSLARYPKLKNVFVTYCLLLGDHIENMSPLEDILPPNINRLVLHNDSWEFNTNIWHVDGVLRKYLEDFPLAASAIPKLKHFYVCSAEIGPTLEKEEKDYQPLVEACERAGFRFGLLNRSEWEYLLGEWKNGLPGVTA